MIPPLLIRIHFLKHTYLSSKVEQTIICRATVSIGIPKNDTVTSVYSRFRLSWEDNFFTLFVLSSFENNYKAFLFEKFQKQKNIV